MTRPPRCSIVLAVAFVLVACAQRPAPTPQPNPVLPPASARPAQTAAATPSVPVAAETTMAAVREAAEGLGYACEQVEPAVSFVVGQLECVREASGLIVVRYASAQDRSNHLRSWAPRPTRPVGEAWLVAADQPADMPAIAEVVTRVR